MLDFKWINISKFLRSCLSSYVDWWFWKHDSQPVLANEIDLWTDLTLEGVLLYACVVWQGYIAIEGPSVYCHCNVAPKRSHYLLKRAIIQFLILPIWTGDTIKESCVKSLIVARPYNAARTLFYRGATSLYICMWSHMLPGGSDRGGRGGLEAFFRTTKSSLCSNYAQSSFVSVLLDSVLGHLLLLQHTWRC